MPMKPRTFRRVVLLGSLGAIILLVAFGYFVVRPWQSQRQLEAMRVDGIAAYESGDYVNAVKLLGRYKKNAEDPDADIFLMHARASEKFEATDGGNYAVAVDSYREYLRRNPDDAEVKQELLPLMNLIGLHVEAQGLAIELINEDQVDDIEVLEGLQYALRLQQASDEEMEPVLLALFEHKDSKFSDADNFLWFLRSRDRIEEADRYLDERIAAYPDRVEEQLLKFQRDFDRSQLNDEDSKYDFETTLSEFCSIIGLDPDPDSMIWAPDAPSLSPSAARYMNRIFNRLQRSDLAVAVQLRSSKQNGDWFNTVWAARRLYWAQRDEELNSMDVRTEKGEPDPDMLGYQYLSAVRANESERADLLVQAIREVVLDRRARAWGAYINALKAIEDAEGVQSRIELQKAIDWHIEEPTFRLRMGDLQLAQGRFNEAIEHWVVASEIVNDEIGSEHYFDTYSWPSPLIKIISAYTGQDRLVEAYEYTQELLRVAPGDYRSVYVVFNAFAELARQDQLPTEVGDQLVTFWDENKERFGTEQRVGLSPSMAGILAYMKAEDAAREEIVFALQNAGEYPGVIVELYDVDDLYNLGIAAQQGMDIDAIAQSSPRGALRSAAQAYQLSQRLEDGLAILDQGLENASDADRSAWERVRLLFLDQYAPELARVEWERILEANPEDIELLYGAVESNAIGGDLAKVDELISRLTEITATEGKAYPSRLRLARANAMVAGEDSRTRTNRTRAMEIIRSVVAAEPTNTKARNMLGQLLAILPSPSAPESERFEPDYEGAIEQFLFIARQLQGRPAQNYLLESADLAYRMGEQDRAIVLLDEFEARFGDDLDAMPNAAERFENFGEDERAIAIYERVLAERAEATPALALADLILKRGDTQRAMSLLQLVRDAERLGSRELLRLSSLYVRAGDADEGEIVAGSGEQYGLEAIDAKLVQARFAELYLSEEDHIQALREATVLEPRSLEAWKGLVLGLVLADQMQEAEAAYAQAVQHVDPDPDLERYGMMAINTPQTAEEMINLPGMQDDPRLREVVRRVERYTNLLGSEDADVLQTRVNMMRDMIRDFPEIEQAQIYGAEQLVQMAINPAIAAEYVSEALRNAPWNTQIMQIAGQLHLRSNNADEALRAVTLWRANSLENSIVANAIRARALIQKGELEEAEEELEPYVAEAFQTSDQPISREVIDAYAFVQLSLGEDPAKIAEGLQPLIASDREIRNMTWLRLAASVVRDPGTGADWIRTAASYSTDEDHLALASAWVTLAFTHGSWDPEYARNALAMIDPAIAEESGPELLVLSARANLIIARSKPDVSDAREEYGAVVQLLLDASSELTGNVALLLDAARYANEGGLHGQAVDAYQQVLQSVDEPSEGFEAFVSNNLAMTMVRNGLDAQDRQVVLDLVRRATALQADMATYWGTRGWVELELGMLAEARESFTRCARIEGQNHEGWVGLAIVNHRLGPDFESDHAQAMDRVRQLHAEQPISAELRSYLEADGLGSWKSP